MSVDEEQPPEGDSGGEEGRERDENGKFKKKPPETPEEPEEKEEPEPPKEPSAEDNKKQIEALNKELVELRKFKAIRMKEVDEYEARLRAQQKAQKTKEDQKLKGFKKEKQSEGDKTVEVPLYSKMSFKNLTEISKKMRKK